MELKNQKDVFLFGYKVEYSVGYRFEHSAPPPREPAWFVNFACNFDEWNSALCNGRIMIVDRNHKNDVDLENADSALFKVIRIFEDKRGNNVAFVAPIAACSKTIASVIVSPSNIAVALLWLWLTTPSFSWIEPIVSGPIMQTGMMLPEDRVQWLISAIKNHKSVDYLAHAIDVWNASCENTAQNVRSTETESNDLILILQRLTKMFDSDYYKNVLRGPERVADLTSLLYRLLNGMPAECAEHRADACRLIDKCLSILHQYEEADCTAYESAFNNAYYDAYRLSCLSDDCIDTIVLDLKDVVASTLQLMRNLFLDKSTPDIMSILKAPARKLGDITKDPFWLVKKEHYYKPAWHMPIAGSRYEQNELERMPGDDDFDVYFDQFCTDPVELDNLRNHGTRSWGSNKNPISASILAKNAARCKNYDISVVGAHSADTVRVHFSRK